MRARPTQGQLLMMVLLGVIGIFIGLWLTEWLRRILMGDE